MAREPIKASVDDFLDNKHPLPVGMDIQIWATIGNTVVASTGSIEVWVCGHCDKTHMKMVLPGMQIEMETSLQPKVAELIARMFQTPQIPDPQ